MWCQTQLPMGAANSSDCKWRHLPVRWTIDEVPDEFDEEDYVAICENSFAVWQATSGIVFERVSSSPNVTIQTHSIDGNNGVLARAQLPCGNVNENTALWIQMDIGEDWADFQGPLTSGFMDITRVLIHEIGHVIGIDHITDEEAIMNPSVSTIRRLLAPDVRENVSRYGERPTGGGDEMLPPLQNCLAEMCNDEVADAVNFGWEAFKRRLKKNGVSDQE